MTRDPVASADQLKLKLTIALDENPDLFKALQCVKEPRRRTRRLRDLAVKGLLMEKAHSQMLAQREAQAWDSPMGEPQARTRTTVGLSVGAMLDWEDSGDALQQEGGA